MKFQHHKLLWSSLLFFLLLINTQKYWSYDLGIHGLVELICILFFGVLAVVALVQLIRLIRERFRNRDRTIVFVALITVLFVTFTWPEGFLPGTAPTDKFERLTMEHTGLDLHGYPYTVVNDSFVQDELFLPDSYYELVVQYDSPEFQKIVSLIEQTEKYDRVEKYGSRIPKKQVWDSLMIQNPHGVWDNYDEHIWFVHHPMFDEGFMPHGFHMYFDKVKRQACITIIVT